MLCPLNTPLPEYESGWYMTSKNSLSPSGFLFESAEDEIQKKKQMKTATARTEAGILLKERFMKPSSGTREHTSRAALYIIIPEKSRKTLTNTLFYVIIYITGSREVIEMAEATHKVDQQLYPGNTIAHREMPRDHKTMGPETWTAIKGSARINLRKPGENAEPLRAEKKYYKSKFRTGSAFTMSDIPQDRWDAAFGKKKAKAVHG